MKASIVNPAIYRTLHCREHIHCCFCRKDREFRRSIVSLHGGPVDYECGDTPPVAWPEGFVPTDELVVPMTISARVTTSDIPISSPKQIKLQNLRDKFAGKVQSAYTSICKTGQCISCGDKGYANMLSTWMENPDSEKWIAIHHTFFKEWMTEKYPALNNEQWEKALESFKTYSVDSSEEKLPPIPDGPGLFFSKIIFEATGEKTENCQRCYDHAIQMNLWNYYGCIKNWRTIKGWVEEERELRGLKPDRKMVMKAVKGGIRYFLAGSKTLPNQPSVPVE